MSNTISFIIQKLERLKMLERLEILTEPFKPFGLFQHFKPPITTNIV